MAIQRERCEGGVRSGRRSLSRIVLIALPLPEFSIVAKFAAPGIVF
jgi:hypothetical protein